MEDCLPKREVSETQMGVSRRHGAALPAGFRCSDDPPDHY